MEGRSERASKTSKRGREEGKEGASEGEREGRQRRKRKACGGEWLEGPAAARHRPTPGGPAPRQRTPAGARARRRPTVSDFFFESRLPRATRHPPEDERTRGGGREGRACCVRETVRLGLCLRLFENSDCACSRTWSLAACAVCAHGPCLRESLGAPSSSDSCCCCSACACMFMVCGIVCVRVDI